MAGNSFAFYSRSGHTVILTMTSGCISSRERRTPLPSAAPLSRVNISWLLENNSCPSLSCCTRWINYQLSLRLLRCNSFTPSFVTRLRLTIKNCPTLREMPGKFRETPECCMQRCRNGWGKIRPWQTKPTQSIFWNESVRLGYYLLLSLYK